MRTAILSETPAAPSGGAGCAGGAYASHVPPRRVRHRSRSSPSRVVLCPPSSRQRSPSASPDRRSRQRASPLTLPTCAVGSAYFSPRPPPVPLRLVVRRPPAPVAAPEAALAAPAPPPAAPDAQAASRVAARRRRVIKRLLRELVAALPLPTAPAVSSVTFTPDTTCISPAVPPHVRDAAVQAISRSNAEARARQERDDRHAGYKSDGEEWVGGVRALRDSHVRLVLRQLRHIERLNRALDRAARSDAAYQRAGRPVVAPYALPPAYVTPR